MMNDPRCQKCHGSGKGEFVFVSNVIGYAQVCCDCEWKPYHGEPVINVFDVTPFVAEGNMDLSISIGEYTPDLRAGDYFPLHPLGAKKVLAAISEFLDRGIKTLPKVKGD
jgi:hypothetical protein